jgi:hypothetical protein
MALLDLDRLTADLSRTWVGFLRDWDRSLRSGNYPETTRYNYLLAAAQLAGYLAEYSPPPTSPVPDCAQLLPDCRDSPARKSHTPFNSQRVTAQTFAEIAPGFRIGVSRNVD